MTTLNLAAFCGQNDIRGWLNQPVIVDEFLVATNGHILVAMPLPEGYGAPEGATPSVPEKTLPYVRDLIAAAQLDSHEARLRVQAHELLPRLSTCERCNGSGVSYEQECDECEGHGEFDYGSHTYRCKNCDGTGEIDSGHSPGNEHTCWACAGLKIGDSETPTPGIGQGQFRLASHYAALICTHVPDAEIRAVPDGEKRAIYFRSATQNVFGVVMPVKVPHAIGVEFDRAVAA